jgi:hypothetical protein
MKMSRDDALICIAKACHEANKAYCEALGDMSQAPWKNTPGELRASAINGVEHVLAKPDVTAEESHQNWYDYKEKDGWVYGPEKNLDKKTHPCMVPFSELPKTQQAKDTLFRSVVLSLAPVFLDCVEEPETSIPDGVLWSATQALVVALGYEINPDEDYSGTKEQAATLSEAVLNGEEEGIILQAAADLATAMGFATEPNDEDLPEAVEKFAGQIENEAE